jgi:hypothetical protein
VYLLYKTAPLPGPFAEMFLYLWLQFHLEVLFSL